MPPKKKIHVPVLAGQLPMFQEPWHPERAQDVRTVSNWLIKLVRLAGTGDAQSMNVLHAQGISEDRPLPDEVLLPQYFHRTQPGETHLGEFDFDSRRVSLKWRDVWENFAAWAMADPGMNADMRAISDRHPPDACFCTHDGVPDPRAEGANKYHLVFMWEDPGG